MESNIEILTVSTDDGNKLVEYLRPKEADEIVPVVEIIYTYSSEKTINLSIFLGLSYSNFY